MLSFCSGPSSLSSLSSPKAPRFFRSSSFCSSKMSIFSARRFSLYMRSASRSMKSSSSLSSSSQPSDESLPSPAPPLMAEFALTCFLTFRAPNSDSCSFLNEERFESDRFNDLRLLITSPLSGIETSEVTLLAPLLLLRDVGGIYCARRSS